MELNKILPLALLIILWWVGVWGFVETIIHMYIRGSNMKALFIYGSMILIVLVIINMNPKMVDYFV